MTRFKASVIGFSAMMALFAIALIGGFSPMAKVQGTSTPVAAVTFATVTNLPTERPPEGNQVSPTVSPEIKLASNDTYLPTAGIVTSGYGSRILDGKSDFHDGIDFNGNIGDPVFSIRDGVVLEAGPAQGYGQWIVVQQSDGRVVEYGHVETILASVGQHVNAGQQIATIGNRGQSTGPHLHVRVRGENPNTLLAAAGANLPSASAETVPTPAPATVDTTPVPAPNQSGPDWDRLMMCESGGDGKWAANTGNGFYGGLQFTQSTWESFGGGKYAARADLASREQQIDIAHKVLDVQGHQAWPDCSNNKVPGWWQGGGSPVEPPAPAPAEDTFVEQAPVQTIPEVAPVQEPVVETLPAPAQTWVDQQVESLPEPVQAPVQQWIEQQVTPTPAPAYIAPVAELPQFDAAPAPSASAFDANAVVDAVNDFVDNNPALGNNPAIAGAVAQLPGLLGIH